MENQSYTLTDTDQSYTHPDFNISPDYCPVEYSYEDTGFTDGGNMPATAITQEGKTSKFFWDTDKSPLGQTQTVTITGTSTTIYGRSNAPETDSTSYILDFADPCIDANFASITRTD